MNSVALAWAAGFYDGEGSTFVRHTKRMKGGTTGKYYPMTTVEMAVSQTRIEPLNRFLAAIKAGKVNGPYRQKNPKHSPYYRWDTAGRPSCHKVLTTLWSYLSQPKKEQAKKVWATLKELRTVKSPRLPELPE